MMTRTAAQFKLFHLQPSFIEVINYGKFNYVSE